MTTQIFLPQTGVTKASTNLEEKSSSSNNVVDGIPSGDEEKSKFSAVLDSEMDSKKEKLPEQASNNAVVENETEGEDEEISFDESYLDSDSNDDKVDQNLILSGTDLPHGEGELGEELPASNLLNDSEEGEASLLQEQVAIDDGGASVEVGQDAAEATQKTQLNQVIESTTKASVEHIDTEVDSGPKVENDEQLLVGVAREQNNLQQDSANEVDATAGKKENIELINVESKDTDTGRVKISQEENKLSGNQEQEQYSNSEENKQHHAGQQTIVSDSEGEDGEDPELVKLQQTNETETNAPQQISTVAQAENDGKGNSPIKDSNPKATQLSDTKTEGKTTLDAAKSEVVIEEELEIEPELEPEIDLEAEQVVKAETATKTSSSGETQQQTNSGFQIDMRTVSTYKGVNQVPVTAGVKQPVGQPGWTEAFVDRVAVIVNERIGSAQIHVEPPQLGPIDVKIRVTGDQANIVFVSQHAVTREALEMAIPRLREVMEQNGLSLGDVNVQQQEQNDRPNQRQVNTNAESEESDSEDQEQQNEEDENQNSPGDERLVSTGTVDFYV